MATPIPLSGVSNSEANKPRDDAEDTTAMAALQEYKEHISTLPLENRVFRLYRGVWFPEFHIAGVIAVHRCFASRPTDVFLATYPKSGTTWIKALTFAAVNRSQHPPSDPCHPLLRLNPHQCVHFLEGTFTDGRSSDLDSLPSPRILATHIPYSVLPDSVASSDCRIVYVCRDPKDVLVATWHFVKKVVSPALQRPVTVDELAMEHCTGITAYGTVWDHVLEYRRESTRRPEKVLFLRYEEMMKEPEASLKRLAAFVGCPFSPEEEKEGVAEEIVRLCSFKNLSNLAVNKSSTAAAAADDWGTSELRVNNDSYFRKGQVGDWRNHMSPEVARRLDEIITQKLQGSGLDLIMTE